MAADDRDALSDIDRELRAALSVTPSPDFAARVRTRVGQEETRDTGRSWIFAAGMLAASAVLVVAASVLWRTNRPLAQNVLQSVTNVPPSIPPAPDTSLQSNANPRLPIERPAAVTTARAANRSLRGPEVLMPPDERLGLERLIELVGRQDESSAGLMTSMAGIAAEANLASSEALAPDSREPAMAPANGGSPNDGALVIAPITFRPLNDDSD